MGVRDGCWGISVFRPVPRDRFENAFSDIGEMVVPSCQDICGCCVVGCRDIDHLCAKGPRKRESDSAAVTDMNESFAWKWSWESRLQVWFGRFCVGCEPIAPQGPHSYTKKPKRSLVRFLSPILSPISNSNVFVHESRLWSGSR